VAEGPTGSPRLDVVFCFWQCDKENHGWCEGPPRPSLPNFDLQAGPSPSGYVSFERKKNTAFHQRARTPRFRHWPVYIYISSTTSNYFRVARYSSAMRKRPCSTSSTRCAEQPQDRYETPFAQVPNTPRLRPQVVSGRPPIWLRGHALPCQTGNF
jgi:hypothetical protein